MQVLMNCLLILCLLHFRIMFFVIFRITFMLSLIHWCFRVHFRYRLHPLLLQKVLKARFNWCFLLPSWSTLSRRILLFLFARFCVLHNWFKRRALYLIIVALFFILFLSSFWRNYCFNIWLALTLSLFIKVIFLIRRC